MNPLKRDDDLINRYIDLTIANDENFYAYWSKSQESHRARIRSSLIEIDQWRSVEQNEIIQLRTEAYRKSRSMLSVVPELRLSYASIPEKWLLAIDDELRLRKAYARSEEVVRSLVKKTNLSQEKIHLTGGIKSSNSIKKKFKENKAHKNKEIIPDFFDLIRFRISVESISILAKISSLMWSINFDNIICCRNYYFYPRGGNPNDSYRAVHFIMRDGFGDIFELQIMTLYRTSICLMDHAVSFKKSIKHFDDNHQEWLINMSKNCNLSEIKKEDYSWYLDSFLRF